LLMHNLGMPSEGLFTLPSQGEAWEPGQLSQ
jgi:hypothetical protein